MIRIIRPPTPAREHRRPAGRVAGLLPGVMVLAACATQQVAASHGGGRGTGNASSSPTSHASGPASASKSPAAHASGSSSPGGTATCTTSELRISLTHTAAAAGTVGGYLTFTNTGNTACRLAGWPSVRGLTASGRSTQLQRATNTMLGSWTYSKPAPVLTLRPEQSAYAVVEGTDNPVGAATKCPEPFTQLKVVPPGNSAGAVISAWLPYANAYLPTCSGDEVSVLLPLSGLQR